MPGTGSDTGKTFIGLRLYLESPDVLHAGPDDDDRSAVTFWYEDGELEQMTKVRDTLSALADAD